MSGFNQLKVLFNKLTTKKPPINPSSFNSELALKTKWSPQKTGGTNITTHYLFKYSENRVGFKISAGFKVFISVFVISGLVFFSIGMMNFFKSGQDDSPAFIFPIIGLLFTGFATFMYLSANRPRVFDKDSGYFWIGKKGPHQTNDKTVVKVFEKLENIEAIQLISEYIRSNKSSYYSYELNLVLKNADRINVIDHGNLEKIRRDAQTLSAFLDVPVWDAINRS